MMDKCFTQTEMPFFRCVLVAWQAHEAELLGFLIHQTGKKHMAEDLLQDVFLTSLRQGEAFCSLDNPRAWLFHVARNLVIDHVRKTKPSESISDDLPYEKDGHRLPVDDLDTCIQFNLKKLSPEDSDIIEKCDLDNHTLRDYSAHHNLTLAAAKSRLLLARKHLREALINHCQVRFDSAGNVCCHTPRKLF